jgi:hypothetical protein
MREAVRTSETKVTPTRLEGAIYEKILSNLHTRCCENLKSPKQNNTKSSNSRIILCSLAVDPNRLGPIDYYLHDAQACEEREY